MFCVSAPWWRFTLVRAMLLIGNGMLMVFYSREWFARNTDLSASVYDKESWIPLSLQPFLGTKLPW